MRFDVIAEGRGQDLGQPGGAPRAADQDVERGVVWASDGNSYRSAP